MPNATSEPDGASTLTSADLHDEVYAVRPEPAWRLLRDTAPVFHDLVDDVWVLSRHDDVRWAFVESDHLSNAVYGRTVGKVFGPSMLQMDGHEHVQRRKIVAPQMMGNRLVPYADVIEGIAARIADEAVATGSFDLVEVVSHRMPGTVIATMLGLPQADLPQFFGWYNAMMAGLWTDPELRRRGHEAHLAFQRYLEPILAERMVAPGTDLISRLLHAEVDGQRMSSVDVGAFMSLLLTAGGETTDKAISNLWWLLAEHPEEYHAVRDDPGRLDLLFSETLRLFPSLIYLGRETTRSFERHGVEVPAGAVVRLNVGAANRDDRVFADPDRFWPDRPDLHLGKELRAALTVEGRAPHLAFGGGAHFCIGYELARYETIAVTAALIARLGPDPTFRAEPPVTAPPSRVCQRLIIDT
jgi:pulcherriminic acid synthase